MIRTAFAYQELSEAANDSVFAKMVGREMGGVVLVTKFNNSDFFSLSQK